MSNRAPKFLLNGINMKRSFIGLQTMQTATYGVIETCIKILPLFILGYGCGHVALYTKERDAFLDEKKHMPVSNIRRESF